MDFKNLEIHFIGFCSAQKAELRECSFTDSDIHSCFMDYTRVHDSRWENAVFRKMYMEKSLFDEVNLNGSSFHNLAMDNSDFENVTLNGTRFKDGSLGGCEFNNTNLGKTRFIGADLSGAEIDEDCSIEGMTVRGIPIEELLKLYNEKN